MRTRGGVVALDAPGAGAGDRIDLSAIDANNRLAGNQAFEFGGSGIGHVRVVDQGTATVVLASTDADPAAELRIVIDDGAVRASAYTADDFIL